MTATRARLAPAGPEADGEAFWHAWDEFFAALRRARGRAARDQPDGLTISQYRLLCAVLECPTARLGELAEQVGASAPTITRMLTALERDGAIRRERAAGDHRRVRVTLTAHGRRLREAKQQVVNAKRDALHRSLTAAEREQAARLLPRLTEALEAL